MNEYKVPIEFFNCEVSEPCYDNEKLERVKTEILRVLKEYGVEATVVSVAQGPTVTTYNVSWEGKTSYKKILSLEPELSLALGVSGVYSYVDFDAGAVSIQIPNERRFTVHLGGLFKDERFLARKEGSLFVALGKDMKNANAFADISKLVHTLVGGATGTGKSTFVHSLLLSLLYKNSPQELNLILIDPKRVEFALYKGLPHLLTDEPITEIEPSLCALDWAINEMNRRYGLFDQKCRTGDYIVNIDEYNKATEGGKLPKILIVIDELADLMLCDKRGTESRLQTLAQKSRAAGIYLLVCSQRLSSDVLSGTVKANFQTRIAFKVSSEVDSRVILGQTGAQKLLGWGDFLFVTSGIPCPRRLQAPFVSSETVQKVFEYLRQTYSGLKNREITQFIRTSVDGGDLPPDDFWSYVQALKIVIEAGMASISMLQRKCACGYTKAGRMIEWMEKAGYITEFDGAKSRRVLITMEEFDNIYGDGTAQKNRVTVKEFEVRMYEKMQYVIRYPDGYKTGEKYPTLFFFHGAGTRGVKIEALIENDFFKLAAKRADYPFVTVAAQCNEETWFDLWETVRSFVEEITRYDFCDKSRVYAVGNSMGGYAVWQLGMSMPETFSAIVPICGGGMYWNAARLKNLPVWAFHGEKDETVKVEESKKMVDAVNACGGNARLTLYPDVAHPSWKNAYVEPELFTWLLSNVKTNK